MSRHLSGNIMGLDLAKWHSCLKMGRAFRACPMALAGIESSQRRGRRSDSDEEEKPDDPNPPRTQTVPSQTGLDSALVTLIRGFAGARETPLSPNIPGLAEPLKGRDPGKAPGTVDFLQNGLVEELWKSLISDPVELLSGNAGVLLGPVNELLQSNSPDEAFNTALRIGESFVGKLLQAVFKPSSNRSNVSSMPTATQPPLKQGRSLVKDVAGGSIAAAAAVGSGILFARGRGGGGGRGVSQPVPRGGGGKFFEAGRKFPILQPR